MCNKLRLWALFWGSRGKYALDYTAAGSAMPQARHEIRSEFRRELLLLLLLLGRGNAQSRGRHFWLNVVAGWRAKWEPLASDVSV